MISDASQATVVVEAMELARKYSAEEATKFIHGVLGSVFGHKRVAEPGSDADERSASVEGQNSNE